MAHVHGLRCRECGREYEVAPDLHLRVVLRPARGGVRLRRDRARRSAARRSRPVRSSIWRYADLLPADRNPAVDLGAGFTPLVRADRLAAELGLGEVWIKNDTREPDELVQGPRRPRSRCRRRSSSASRSRRARPPATSPTRSPRTRRTPGCAASCSSPPNLEQGKIVTTAVYGGNVVAIDGNYDDVNRLCAELAGTYPWAFVNVNMRTVLRRGLEDARVRDRRAARLGGARPRRRADRQRLAAHQDPQGLRRAVQGRAARRRAAACACPARRRSGARRSRRRGSTSADTIKPVKPDTIAKSLAIGNPADGYFALDAVRQTGGGLAAVTDDEIVDAHEAARPHRGDLRRDRRRRHDRDAEAARGRRHRPPRRARRRLHHRPRAEDARRGRAHRSARPPTIAPTLDAFHDAFPPDIDAGVTLMAVTVRIPTQLRELSGGASEVSADGGDRRRRARPSSRPRTPASPSGSSTTRASCAAS